MSFGFVDLFSGIGGFHAALSALGGVGLLASEIDPHPARVYARNWGLEPTGDVRELSAAPAERVPDHALLAGGFPCQPFSKSGHQRGMGELRGQMFNEILRIIEVKRPPVVVLENVRNIAGPRQRPVWDAIVQGLREAGYRTPSQPCVYSPHLLARELGGSPQTRDRVYIFGTYVGRDRAIRETDVQPVISRAPSPAWDPATWSLEKHILEDEHLVRDKGLYALGSDELRWIAAWNDFLARTRDIKLPGFPMWSRYWDSGASVDTSGPDWKQRFESQNITFYQENRVLIDQWLRANPQLREFPGSRQKLEWQAGDSPRDLRTCLLQFRPSGIRAKKPNYAPALVAMAQTPVVGPRMRKFTVRESARLQAFPDWFDFGSQPLGLSYKQLGNAVHVGVAYHLIRTYILNEADDIVRQPGGVALVGSVRRAAETYALSRASLEPVVISRSAS